MSPFGLIAYLDPGSGSLLLQAMLGGFAGFLVITRHLYRTIRFGKCPQSPVDGNQACP
jgi:hypothetical protein